MAKLQAATNKKASAPPPVLGSGADGSAVDSATRLRQAETLVNVSRQVATAKSLNDTLKIIVDLVTKETNAERGSLFLNDPSSGELYSRIAKGSLLREIRFLNTTGIAGEVFNSGEGIITNDAYADDRFNNNIDEQTGFKTRSICCAPICTVLGEVIGVVQCHNRRDGDFTQQDLDLLAVIATHAAVALQSTQFVERLNKSREQEMQFLDMVSDVTSELELGALLNRVMAEATHMLNADRATLFLNDEKSGELFSRLETSDGVGEIRMKNHKGIAGTVFKSGKSVNIPYAYADLRFNPDFDRKTGYFTRSILCVPVVNKSGKVIGATQILNKRGGPFTKEDEARLKAFTAQVSIALENAKLFDDVQSMKNYNDAMLQSMSNGVITFDEDGHIVTCNESGLEILRSDLDDMVGESVEDFFDEPNAWVARRLRKMEISLSPEIVMDREVTFDDDKVSVNATFLPLRNAEGRQLGSMLLLEDISSEKRMKATMSRYMDPGVADQLMASTDREGDFLGGKNIDATILFSDIRSFTTLTEELGAHGTVAMLNDYFTIMVECITREEGMLDKFIGDAIMAGFGLPLAHDDDADRALRSAVTMLRELEVWNCQRRIEGTMPIDIGIGLNTDTIVAGNIGSPKRMDYTMIGDGVNLAARLESACKTYSAKILISEFTYRKLRGTYRMRDVDKVIVKGKTEPVTIYEVLEHHDEDSFPNLFDSVDNFKSGRDYYERGDWEKSMRAFRKAHALAPSDKLANDYIDRCMRLKNDPPKDWEGVWVMTEK